MKKFKYDKNMIVSPPVINYDIGTIPKFENTIPTKIILVLVWYTYHKNANC